MASKLHDYSATAEPLALAGRARHGPVVVLLVAARYSLTLVSEQLSSCALNPLLIVFCPTH